ncbi:SusC/RagA family TonB-linked outer membrane protein [Mucilaginibacter conchicola]|nr:SusC/RagA family TonB-linked outer membrane protein [Mucilaginibacter conchicola]
MKITALILLVACLHINAASIAQKITLKQKNASLETVFNQIRKQSTYNFIYTTDVIGKAKTVTIDVQNADIDKVLAICFNNQPLSYSLVDNVVIVKEGPTPITKVAEVPDPIRGKVVDGKGQAVAGASVSVKGTTRGVITDANGNFSINATKGETLVVSFIGFDPTETTVGDTNPMQITLAESTKQLNQVVVTALGIRKQQRALGYSTTEVAGDKFTQARETNIGNALTGQVAGVSVSGVSTGPSGSSRVVIRGNASLKGRNQPLYVIDGVPLDNSNQGFAGAYGGSDFGDGLSTINPDDIASIQVLKGVAASALYGYRGGNGAILITTKSGQKNAGIGIELNNNLTFNQVVDLRDDIQYTYGQGFNGVKPATAAASSSGSLASWGAKIDGSPFVDFAGNARTYSAQRDNYKNFFKTGVTNQTSVALSGANDKGHFRLGLSNLYLTQVLPNSSMKQQGINYNAEYNITPKLTVNLNANYVFENVKNRPSFSDSPGNAIATVNTLGSTFDIRWLKDAVDANGNEIVPNQDNPYTNNPYFVTGYFQNKTARNRLTGGVTLRYKFTDYLSLQGQVTRDGYVLDRTEITPTGTAFMYGDNGFLTQIKTDYHELNYNFLLGFNKTYGDFKVHANVGGNSQENVNSTGGIYGAGPFQVPFFYSPSNIVDKPFNYAYYRYKVNSFFGSADLGYKSWLYLTVTGRNDWFSTLSPKSNRYFYPSVSGSFVFSDAFKMPAWVSFGKLRASYANSSNGTDPYQNLLTYRLEGYSINGQPIGNINQTKIPNKDLRPIEISEKEIGLNMQFFDNRLGFDVAYYDKQTTNDILDVAVSSSSGYLSNVVNVGKLRNRGFEVLLTGSPIRTKDFAWNTSFNIAINNNKVLALTPPDNNPVAVNDDNYARWGDAVSIQHIVGMPYAQIMGTAYKRDGKGNIVYGADGYPLTSSDTPVPLGSAIYKTTGGFNNDFRYKSLSLSFLFDFKFGAKIYSGSNVLYYDNGEQTKTLQGREGGYVGPGVNEAGQPNTVSVRAQDYFHQIATGDHQISEEFLYDASFIKLRSVSLGFAFPQKMLQGTFIKGLNISVVGRNLAILMKHTPNIDPESNLNNTNAQGLELFGYPSVRNIGFNLNAKF